MNKNFEIAIYDNISAPSEVIEGNLSFKSARKKVRKMYRENKRKGIFQGLIIIAQWFNAKNPIRYTID